MLVLFETPAGYALFRTKGDGEKLLARTDDVWAHFETAEKAHASLHLHAFRKFTNTAEALEGATAIVEGKLDGELKRFLRDNIDDAARKAETLAVADAKLGSAIAKKLGIAVLSDSSVLELMRGIRAQIASLVAGLPEAQMSTMSLGLAHSLSRYKLKFSPDKVDTMIVQAIALLDDLDKELNTYAMRVKEWFGWHFPEMAKLIVDNLAFARCVIKMQGRRELCSQTSFDDVLPEDLESQLKQLAEISMGTEISDEDVRSVMHLCEQIVGMFEYRAQLYDYLKNRMMAIAPNLTTLVGELVGARLISHAGSLLNLAKQPASTVQILGAEKALFRALKTKKDTPKYGLIYHASLVGQAGQKLKGKMARMVAAKAALAIRVDALSDNATASSTDKDGNAVEMTEPDLAIQQRAKLELQLRRMEGHSVHHVIKDKTPVKQLKKVAEPVMVAEATTPQETYNIAADNTLKSSAQPKEESESSKKKDKKDKKEKKEKKEKKRKAEDDDGSPSEDEKEKKKKRKEEKKKKKESKE